MRKLTASLLATAVLAGGALTGAAVAAPAATHQEHRFGDRVTSVGRGLSTDRDTGSRIGRVTSSRDSISYTAEHGSRRER